MSEHLNTPLLVIFFLSFEAFFGEQIEYWLRLKSVKYIKKKSLEVENTRHQCEEIRKKG